MSAKLREELIESVARAICEERFVEVHEEAVKRGNVPAMSDPRDKKRIDLSWPLFRRHAAAALSAVGPALAKEQGL